MPLLPESFGLTTKLLPSTACAFAPERPQTSDRTLQSPSRRSRHRALRGSSYHLQDGEEWNNNAFPATLKSSAEVDFRAGSVRRNGGTGPDGFGDQTECRYFETSGRS